MKSKTFIALIPALFLGASAFAESIIPWPVFRGSAAQTASVDTKIPDKLSVLWSFPAGDGVEATPVHDGKTAYIGTLDGKFHAVNLADGKALWTAKTGPIKAAACIVGWHLNEARRLLADLDTPPSLAAAIRLDAWLRNEAQAYGTDRVPTKRIYQYGPNCVRDSRDLRAALAVLAERGGRGWSKTGVGGAWRSIRRCWMGGSDRRRFDFDTGGGCYCCYSCYRRPARTLIGSRSSNGSRGWRVGNRESSR